MEVWNWRTWNLEPKEAQVCKSLSWGFTYIPGMLTFIMRELLKNSFRATLDITPDVSWHSKKIPGDIWRYSAFPEFSALQCCSSKWDFSCQRTKNESSTKSNNPQTLCFSRTRFAFIIDFMNRWICTGRAGKSSNRSHCLRQRSTCDDTRLGDVNSIDVMVKTCWCLMLWTYQATPVLLLLCRWTCLRKKTSTAWSHATDKAGRNLLRS